MIRFCKYENAVVSFNISFREIEVETIVDFDADIGDKKEPNEFKIESQAANRVFQEGSINFVNMSSEIMLSKSIGGYNKSFVMGIRSFKKPLDNNYDTIKNNHDEGSEETGQLKSLDAAIG